MRRGARVLWLAIWIAIEPPVIWVKDHGVVYVDAPVTSWLRHGEGKWRSELACENWKAQVLAQVGFSSELEKKQFEAIRCVPLENFEQ